MNSSEISAYLRAKFIKSRCEYGVLPADFVKTVSFSVNNDIFYIFNNQPSHLGGEHWLAICKKNERLEFFDSYGMGMNFYGKYFSILEKKYVFYQNKKRLQSLYSNVCGQFCIFYLFMRYDGYSLNDIEKMFSSDTVKNDKIVNNYILKMKKCNVNNINFIQCCKNQCEKIN